MAGVIRDEAGVDRISQIRAGYLQRVGLILVDLIAAGVCRPHWQRAIERNRPRAGKEAGVSRGPLPNILDHVLRGRSEDRQHPRFGLSRPLVYLGRETLAHVRFAMKSMR